LNSTDLFEEKSQLRKALRSRRDSLPAELRKLYSGRIIGQLASHPLFLDSRTPGLFSSFGSEVETGSLLESQMKQRGFVCLPRYTGKNHIEFYKVEGTLEGLIPSRLGILEPDPARHSLVDPAAMDLFVVPGVGFDPQGGRIGQGQGCYDHYFERINRETPCIGLCFDCMMVEKVPAGHTDHPMTAVISEAGIFRYSCHAWISSRPEQTHHHASIFARWIRPPRVVRLSGQLGAGKTEWVRGFLRSLGWDGRVRSPTFSLENVYEFESMRIYHLDGYRLASPSQLDRDRLCEIMADPEAVVLVEWPERFGKEIPFTSPHLSFERIDETTRRISSQAFLEKDRWDPS